MINFTVGNIFDSPAQALVNTVNCEGYMGKGLAYQFKLKYPETNADYIKACRSRDLRIGTIHYYYENGKYVFNFPTKNKWREDSRIEYIQKGLDALILLINNLRIQSIAIPPLGSGNGKLNWSEVRSLIIDKLSELSNSVDITVYEPSYGKFTASPMSEPQLSLSALILMQIKKELKSFNRIRLQKTAYFFNIFSNSQYFKFKKHKFGPYDNAINIISRNIKEFQEYHGVKNTDEAYEILYKKLVSSSVDESLNKFSPFIRQAAEYVNQIPDDKKLEGISTVLYILECNKDLDRANIIQQFKEWSEDKASRFSEQYIEDCIDYLYDTHIIENAMTGYYILN